MDNARLLVFEAYCRIHQCIDLRMLAAKLNMDESAAEKWVVNLIRNADLNAKIDSQVSAAHLWPWGLRHEILKAMVLRVWCLC